MTNDELIKLVKFLTIKLYSLEDDFNNLLEDLTNEYNIEVETYYNKPWEEEVADAELKYLLNSFKEEAKYMDKRISENSFYKCLNSNTITYEEYQKILEQQKSSNDEDDDDALPIEYNTYK